MNKSVIKMELHKVLREIKVHGLEYDVYRKKHDKYGEVTKEEPEKICSIHGLFHVSKSYVTQKISDGTETHSKGQTMLLVAYEDTRNIKNNDFIIINGNNYKIVSKNNIQEYNIVSDISLELILNGDN